MKQSALAALAAVVCATFVAPAARGALPPAFGGTLHMPGTAPLRAPHPLRIRTPLEATLARAVFDTLYEVRDEAIVPRLAAAPPEQRGSVVTIRLREGLRRHDGRSLRAQDVVRSLRGLEDTPSEPWLDGFARRGGHLDASAPDALTVRVRLTDPELDVARRLAAAPLAVVARGGTGTGPFRARLRGGELHLQSFRLAARGAPYLRGVRVLAPTDRERELRSFDLGRLDASWRGASLYDEPGQAVGHHALPTRSPVLLVAHPRARNLLAALDRAIDRRRLARVGLSPSDRLHPALGAPGPPGSRTIPPASPPLRLLVVARDALHEEVAGALVAQLDERRWSVAVVRAAPDRYEEAVRNGHWDLRVVQVPPPRPDAPALLAAALIAAGTPGQAADALRAPDAESLRGVASALPALVLGHRRQTLHHVATLRGLSHDALGRLRLGALHRARSVRP